MFSQLESQISAAPASDFWFWTVGALLLALAAFYFIFHGLMRARIIEDTPTSKIRSAAQGYVELIGTGKLMDGPPIIGPLTGRHCTWYDYKIERQETYYVKGHRRTRWKTVESGTSQELFLVEDETGPCIIDPEGAEVTSSHSDTWYGNSRRPSGPPSAGGGLLSIGDYRYSERRLHGGEPLYAIGHFKTVGTDYQGDLREDVGALLRHWKKHPQDYLKRFDADKDGKIDVQEWEQVRKAAEQEALLKRAERTVTPVANVLSKGKDRRRPFLLSATPQHALARKYRFIAGGALTGFVLSGGAATWLLLVRFAT